MPILIDQIIPIISGWLGHIDRTLSPVGPQLIAQTGQNSTQLSRLRVNEINVETSPVNSRHRAKVQ